MAENDKSGKAKGGIARALKLTPEERKTIAQKAAKERWSGDVLMATHGSPDRPLRIGNLEIPCYVLSNGMRVLSGRGMQSALALGQRHGAILKEFIGRSSLKDFINNDLAMVLASPVKFVRPGRGGKTASGYEATILADICDVVLAARKAEALSGKELDVAEQCEILVRGFARVGIIALVDEATGYEKDRAKDALAKILEVFIAKELQPWVKTFDSDYYQELFRLRGLKYPTDTVQRPLYFGILTNDIVYKRLAPGVLEELKRLVEKNSKGRPRNKLFQRLTNDVGYSKLREHLASVITIMKLSNQYLDFLEKLDKIHPRYNSTLLLPFDEYDVEKDSGKGI